MNPDAAGDEDHRVDQDAAASTGTLGRLAGTMLAAIRRRGRAGSTSRFV